MRGNPLAQVVSHRQAALMPETLLRANRLNQR
jgi:hypothetical protein